MLKFKQKLEKFILRAPKWKTECISFDTIHQDVYIVPRSAASFPSRKPQLQCGRATLDRIAAAADIWEFDLWSHNFFKKYTKCIWRHSRNWQNDGALKSFNYLYKNYICTNAASYTFFACEPGGHVFETTCFCDSNYIS